MRPLHFYLPAILLASLPLLSPCKEGTSFLPPTNRFIDFELPPEEATALSPDGKRFAVLTQSKSDRTSATGRSQHLLLIDTKTGKTISDLKIEEYTDRALFSFTPDGKYFASIHLRLTPKDKRGPYSSPPVIRLRSTATWKEERQFEIRKELSPARSKLAISNDVLVTYRDGVGMFVYDLTSGKELRAFRDPPAVWRMVLSQDGRRLLTWDVEGTLHSWDVRKGTLLREIHRFRDDRGRSLVRSIAISPDGAWCAAETWEYQFWVFDTAKGTEMANGRFHMGNGCLFFSAGGKALVAAGHGLPAGVFVWDWQASPHPRGDSFRVRIEPLSETVYLRTLKPQAWSADGNTLVALDSTPSPAEWKRMQIDRTFSLDYKRLRRLQVWDLTPRKAPPAAKGSDRRP